MEHLNEIMNIDDEATSTEYKKGSIIQREGDITSRAFFVKKGLLRSYSIDDKGKEHIFTFAPEGWVVADIASHEFDHPAQLYIDCLEDAEVVIFNRNNLTMSGLSPEQYKSNIKMLARRSGMLQKRVIMLMSASATERYQTFLETYPELPNRISQKLIASYLGITPEALSKLRGNMARAK